MFTDTISPLLPYCCLRAEQEANILSSPVLLSIKISSGPYLTGIRENFGGGTVFSQDDITIAKIAKT
jgi:hypothetical protein